MNIIKPKKLKKGDTIGFLSVSGDIREIERIEKAQSYFEKLGFNVVVSDTTYKKNRYMAGSDAERVESLHSFFLDKNIDAIMCTRGGYGCLRLINDIDYDLIRNNPKIFVGYSDLTILLLMMYKKTGLVSFHGPMINGDFGEDEICEFTQNNLFKILCEQTSEDVIKATDRIKTYYSGVSDGLLWGGNLATIASLCGQDFIPDEKFILFLEDLNEPVYKIDKMLTQLINIKKFRENISGIVLGKFTQVDNEEFLEELFNELAQDLQIPICGGFEISHNREKITLPVGVKVKLDSNVGEIKFLEKILSES